LNGVPMTITDVNAALGSQGDILLADFSQYMFFARGMMPSIEISAECKFLERNTVLRVGLRCAGKPAKPVYNTTLGGGEAYGPFVTLEAR
jgi:HK97 family phage major capsid protein